MWLQCLSSVYLIAHALATQISYDTVNISSSSENDEKLYSWPDQQDFNFKTTDQLQSSPNIQPFNSSEDITVVDQILLSGRQGRNIEGYDNVYSDPEVKNALQIGNDTVARSFIRDKLCSLGLMNCDGTEERRPYYSPYKDIRPQDVIYAQPITIRPVGRPLPAIPVKRPGGFIKPQHGFLSDLSYLEPPPALHSKPGYHTPPFIGQPPPSFIGPHSGYRKPTGIHHSKPVHEAAFEGEASFDNKHINKKQIIIQNDANVQQHIHHHYHHNDQNGGSIIPPFDPHLSNNGLNNYGYGGNLHNNYDEYRKNFDSKNIQHTNSLNADYLNNNYANRYPQYEKLQQEFPIGEANINKGFENDKKLGSESGSFNGYYNNKNDEFGINKEFSNYNSNNNLNSYNKFPPNYANGLSGDNYNECICVRYDECILDHADRKDDLHLEIDPRNLKKNITAEYDNTNVTDSNSRQENARALKNIQDKETKITDNNSQNTTFTNERIKRHIVKDKEENDETDSRQSRRFSPCSTQHVCCKRHQLYQGNIPLRNNVCGVRYNEGIAGRIKTPSYIDGDSEFGEYPWQVAILRKELEEKENIYVCGGTLISPRHVVTAAHCIKTYSGRDLRARLGEWDVNHDVEFFPYIERNVVNTIIHPEFYAGTLYNDIAILKLDYDIDFNKNPHISPACLPNKFDDFVNTRCWTTGWGKNAFGDFGKYQNILKEVDVPIISNNVCEHQMRRTRLGPSFNLHPGFVCAGGEEGKDACKGDGGGPMVCEHQGKWQIVGIVSWGIGCGQAGIPGVYTRVSYYSDWIHKIIRS